MPEDVRDWNKPRGSFDLTCKGASFVVHKAPIRPDQSPEYIFSIMGGYTGEGRVTWKLIADTQEDFERWTKGAGHTYIHLHSTYIYTQLFIMYYRSAQISPSFPCTDGQAIATS